jgi:two-component system, NtrC family, response regulator HydG
MHLPKNRILCVDDHEDSTSMMKVLLEIWNQDVTVAGSAADGIRLAQSEPFDMYLLETRLPDESGFELCKQICMIPGHAPVVFISTAAYETDKQRGLRAGALAYLTKPVDFEAMKITLTQVLLESVGKGFGKHLEDSCADVTQTHVTMA